MTEESYPCKYDYLCKHRGRFNPHLTLDKPKHPTNPCTHGGGPGCRTWRKYTNIELSPGANTHANF
jgi:hypothetical protein